MKQTTWIVKYGLVLAAALMSVSSLAQTTAKTGKAQSLEARLAVLEKRLQTQEDIEAINKLTRAYGYYVDKQLWDEITVLFTDNARVEIAGRGVYKNKAGVVRLFKDSMGRGKNGLSNGMVFNHMILQGIVDVNPDGNTAVGRWRAFVQIGGKDAFAMWSEGTYRNDYVKENGVWKFSGMHFFATYYTGFDQGWQKGGRPNNGPDKSNAPDEPQSVDYDVFPGHYVPPFHYANPVTGRAWTIEDTLKYSTKGQGPAPAGAGAGAPSSLPAPGAGAPSSMPAAPAAPVAPATPAAPARQ